MSEVDSFPGDEGDPYEVPGDPYEVPPCEDVDPDLYKRESRKADVALSGEPTGLVHISEPVKEIVAKITNKQNSQSAYCSDVI